jgi:hypothetical protein
MKVYRPINFTRTSKKVAQSYPGFYRLSARIGDTRCQFERRLYFLIQAVIQAYGADPFRT